jgi:hypothetical protein
MNTVRSAPVLGLSQFTLSTEMPLTESERQLAFDEQGLTSPISPIATIVATRTWTPKSSLLRERLSFAIDSKISCYGTQRILSFAQTNMNAGEDARLTRRTFRLVGYCLPLVSTAGRGYPINRIVPVDLNSRMIRSGVQNQ